MPNVVGKATLIPGGVEQLALEDESGDLNKSNVRVWGLRDGA